MLISLAAFGFFISIVSATWLTTTIRREVPETIEIFTAYVTILCGLMIGFCLTTVVLLT